MNVLENVWGIIMKRFSFEYNKYDLQNVWTINIVAKQQ